MDKLKQTDGLTVRKIRKIIESQITDYLSAQPLNSSDPRKMLQLYEELESAFQGEVSFLDGLEMQRLLYYIIEGSFKS